MATLKRLWLDTLRTSSWCDADFEWDLALVLLDEAEDATAHAEDVVLVLDTEDERRASNKTKGNNKALLLSSSVKQ